MALQYLFDPNKQFQSIGGVNEVSGFLRVFLNGTDDRATTYRNFDGGLNEPDIVLDSYGRAVVIVDDTKTYRLEVYNRLGGLMWTVSNYKASGGSGGGSGTPVSVEGTVGEIDVDENTEGGVKHFVVGLAATIKNAIATLTMAVNGLANTLNGKKDRQSPVSVSGSTTKTLVGISQDSDGVITPEFDDIDFGSQVLSVYPESFDSMTPDEREDLDAKITEVSSNGGIVILWNRGFPSVLSYQGAHEYHFTWVDVDVTFECMKYILTYDTETKLFSFTDQNIYLGNYTAGNGIGISNRVISVKCKNDGGLDKDSSGTYLKCKTNQGIDTDNDGAFVKRKTDGGLDCDSNGLLVKCKTNGGLSTDANGVYVTNPLKPASGTNKLLVIDSYGDVEWEDRIKRFYKSLFGINSLPTLTATDISNGYIDLPFDWNLDESTAYLSNFSFSLVITTASYTRNSMTLDIGGICSKIKFSVWQTGNTWFSTDSAHGADPQGMIFNDIDASTLVSAAGYPKLETPVRVVGGNDSLTAMRGPSIRFMLSSSAQIGDKVNLSGIIFGTYHNTGF